MPSDLDTQAMDLKISPVPIYVASMAQLIHSIVDSALPIDAIPSSLRQREQSVRGAQLPVARVLILCFTKFDRSDLESSPPAVHTLRQLSRFGNIDIHDVDLGSNFGSLYSMISYFKHSGAYEKVILYDYVHVFSNAPHSGVPIEYFNYRYFITVMNLVASNREFLHLVECQNLAEQPKLIPQITYYDEGSLIEHLARPEDHKAQGTVFVGLKTVLHNLGFVYAPISGTSPILNSSPDP